MKRKINSDFATSERVAGLICKCQSSPKGKTQRALPRGIGDDVGVCGGRGPWYLHPAHQLHQGASKLISENAKPLHQEKDAKARHRDTTGPADDFDYLGRIKKTCGDITMLWKEVDEG